MAADGAEVVVAMEEGEVADGDGVIRLQKETTRRGIALQLWSVFLAQYPYEAWQRGAGEVNCLFLHIPCTSKRTGTLKPVHLSYETRI